jgi:hypothetical protein
MARAKQQLSTIQRLACLEITGVMRTTPTVVEALVGLPPLDMVVQGEARASAHGLWSLGSWSYLHPNCGHSSILVWLQQSGPIFNMRVDVMMPAYNFKPKYRVTALTTGAGTPPIVKEHVWFTDGSRMRGRVYGQSIRRRLCFSFGRYAAVFQAKVFAILACVHDIKVHGTPEKHVFALTVWRP